MRRRMRSALSLLLSATIALNGCAFVDRRNNSDDLPSGLDQSGSTELNGSGFNGPSDPEFQTYLESTVYSDLVQSLTERGYFVEKVESVYVSEEYLSEQAYNSQANIYFGFTLSDLDAQFEGARYVFTVNDAGDTTAQQFQAYDNQFDEIVSNLAIGGGVILLCVTVSVVSGPAAPAMSMIFACSTKAGIVGAVSGGAISGIAEGVITGLETGEIDDALSSAAVAASEGFMWGAIGGAVAGGASEAAGLRMASLKGLSMNQAAQIQRETGYPLDVIAELNSMDQYRILRNANIRVGSAPVAGRTALVRDIELDKVDEFGRSNLERMRLGLAPLDNDGMPYELHHVGQQTEGTLAILTREEHRSAGNYKIWHLLDESDVSHGREWAAIRKAFWKDMAEQLSGGVV